MQLHFRFLAHWLLLSLEWFASGFWRYQLNNWWINGQFLKLWWLWRCAFLELLPLVNFRHLGKMKAAQKNFEQNIELRKLARLQLSFFLNVGASPLWAPDLIFKTTFTLNMDSFLVRDAPFWNVLSPPPLRQTGTFDCAKINLTS